MKDRRLGKSRAVTVVLLSGVLVLVVAGIVMLGAYVYFSRQSQAATGYVNPLDVVQPKAIAPDLAVLPLAGEDDERVIKAALDAGETETAYTVLAYSVLLPDMTRSGQWALLADTYRQQDAARAAVCYQATLDQSSLASGLSDLTRADLALQVSRGMTAPEQKPVARLALAEAENLARYSVNLLPAQRRDILNRVVAGYRSIGDGQTAATLAAQVNAAVAGPSVKLKPAGDLLAGLRGSVVLPADVTQAIVARQQAAANLAARWLSSGPSARSDLASALGAALTAEDAVRTTFYGQASSLSAADQLALQHDQVAWLTVKYRAARGAYGVSLVPAWEGQTDALRTNLASAYTELVNGYGRQLDTMNAADAVTGRVELLRQALLWDRLGLFPDHAEATLSQQLIDSAKDLWSRQGGAGLVVITQDVHGERFYLLSGADAQKSQ